MKTYLYLVKCENNFESDQDAIQQHQQQIMPLFDTSIYFFRFDFSCLDEFYQNGFYELVKEKVSFLVKQRDQAVKQLKERNQEINQAISKSWLVNNIW